MQAQQRKVISRTHGLHHRAVIVGDVVIGTFDSLATPRVVYFPVFAPRVLCLRVLCLE